MKKLVLLSLSALVALGISASAADRVIDSHVATVAETGHHHVRKAPVADPFAGIDLTDAQKARLHEVFGGVKASQADSEKARKVVAQIKKVLTSEQYIQYLENVATDATSHMMLPRR